MAVLFVIGSACFIAGIASQWASTPRPAIGVTFFVGSIFFTTAAYLQWSEAVNAERRIAVPRHRRRWRPASWESRRIDWLSAAVQLIGTFLFNLSTFAALNHSLTTHQSNTRVWAPDAFGSIAFLISSELAFAEVCHRWLCLRCRTLAWKIVALNLLGSIAFGISAIASLLEPSTRRARERAHSELGDVAGRRRLPDRRASADPRSRWRGKRRRRPNGGRSGDWCAPARVESPRWDAANCTTTPPW